MPWALRPQKSHISLRSKLVALAKGSCPLARWSPSMMAKRDRLAQARCNAWATLVLLYQQHPDPIKGHHRWSARGTLSQEESPLHHSLVLLASTVSLASPSPILFQPPYFSQGRADPLQLFPSLFHLLLLVTSLEQGNTFFHPLVQFLGNDLHAFIGSTCPCLEMQEKRIARAWHALALQNIPRGGCLVSLAMSLERHTLR